MLELALAWMDAAVPKDSLAWATLVVGAVGAVATGVAAIYAAVQFATSRRAAQAQLLVQWLDEYDSPEIRRARKQIALTPSKDLDSMLHARDLADFLEVFAYLVEQKVLNFEDAAELLGYEVMKYHAHLRDFELTERRRLGDEKMYVSLEWLANSIPKRIKDLKAPSGEDVTAFLKREAALLAREDEDRTLAGRTGDPSPGDRVYVCMRCEVEILQGVSGRKYVYSFVKKGDLFPNCTQCTTNGSWRAFV